MKIALLGAAGVRTPLMIQAVLERCRAEPRLPLKTLALMDINEPRLGYIQQLVAPLLVQAPELKVVFTTQAEAALDGANFVITAFRTGGTSARIIDERVPLAENVLGQEAVGPGGFAMALRNLPILLDYIHQMRRLCPHAWLINFTNPTSMLAEAAVRFGNWPRTVGVCDVPMGMRRLAAAVLGAPPERVSLDYFGLNHLGWVYGVRWQGNDYLADLIAMLRSTGNIPFLPFEVELIAALGMIPNEYLYYYYNHDQVVRHNLQAGQTRGEQVLALNEALFAELDRAQGDAEAMQAAYQAYMHQRSSTYLLREAGRKPRLHTKPKRRPTAGPITEPKANPLPVNLPAALAAALEGNGAGYAEVALDLIEALSGVSGGERRMILNLPNRGALPTLPADAVIETPAYVGRDQIEIPSVSLPATPQVQHCLGLVQQVKACERLIMEAAMEGAYRKAWLALSLHPFVPDSAAARRILDGYIQKHGAALPPLG